MVQVRPSVAGLPTDDERVLPSRQELYAALRSEGIAAETEPSSVEGTKRQLTDMVLALGGPTAVVGAAVRVFHLWLRRDRRRSPTLTADRGDGKPIVIEIQGEAVSEQTVNDAVQKLIGGRPGPPPKR